MSATGDVKHDRKEIIVLGAGVVGLTTALTLQEQEQYNVTIVAETLPRDPPSIKYTSRWAGANHGFNPIVDIDAHLLEEQTFHKLWEMSAPGSDAEEALLRVPQKEQFSFDRGEKEPMEVTPGFRHLSPEELVPGAKYGFALNTVTIDVPVYLDYLLSRFRSSGGRILRGSVMHINQVLEGGTSLFPGGEAQDSLPDALVVCVGIGARFLGGVEDQDVYPVRGQTVLLKAPWVNSGCSAHLPDSLTYIIPRKGGDVILGGTRVENDWYPRPRPETKEEILAQTLKICPQLAPPEIRAHRLPTVDDIRPLIVGEGCGLRPARRGGARIELDFVDGKEVNRSSKIPVVFNYGHGGFGYQSSWGYASKVLSLLGQVFVPES